MENLGQASTRPRIQQKLPSRLEINYKRAIKRTQYGEKAEQFILKLD